MISAEAKLEVVKSLIESSMEFLQKLTDEPKPHSDCMLSRREGRDNIAFMAIKDYKNLLTLIEQP